jgi:Family of unknown function (DUF6504)
LSEERCTLKVFEHMFDQPSWWRVTSTPILHQGTDSGSNGCETQVRSKTVRRYDDTVEVRKGADEDPEQFLWRGRLWQVREVVAHWVETGAWWARRPTNDQPGSAGGVDTDLLREREVWRVAAARGRVAAQKSPENDPGFGVFDLVFSWSEGSWQLVRAMD